MVKLLVKMVVSMIERLVLRMLFWWWYIHKIGMIFTWHAGDVHLGQVPCLENHHGEPGGCGLVAHRHQQLAPALILQLPTQSGVTRILFTRLAFCSPSYSGEKFRGSETADWLPSPSGPSFPFQASPLRWRHRDCTGRSSGQRSAESGS